MWSQTVIACFCLLVAVQLAACDGDDVSVDQAPEEDRSHVTPYVIMFDDEKQFEAEVTSRSDALHFVMFYAPWCHFCKELSPIFNELGLKYNVQKTKANTVIMKVDCTKLPNLCRKYSIKSFPTLLLFTDAIESHTIYQGTRTIDGLVSYLKEHNEQGHVTGGPVELDTAEFEEMSRSAAESIYFVMFYSPTCKHCEAVMPTWNRLAEIADEGQLNGIIVAQVSCETERELCLKESIFQYPAMAIYKHGKRQDKYEGHYDVELLKDYAISMRMHVLANNVFDRQESNHHGIELNQQNVEQVMKSGFVFVNFYKPWCSYCQALAPKWAQLADKFAGSTKVVIASVDCTVQDLICNKYKIVGYPSMILFFNGKQTIMYTGVHEYQLIFDFVAEMTNQKEL